MSYLYGVFGITLVMCIFAVPFLVAHGNTKWWGRNRRR